MTYPVVYDQSYSYTGFSASLGDGSFPGTQLDADMAGLSQGQANILAFLQGSFRSDGVLEIAALPTATDLTAYVGQADASAIAAAASQTAAAASASSASGSATAASGSAGAAAASAAAAAALVADGGITTVKLAAGVLSADTNGRAKMADGYFTNGVVAKFADGLFAADAGSRAKFADGIWTTAKIANDAIDHTKLATGAVVQVVNVMVGTSSTTTSLIPADDTIPQNTEGAEFMTLAITPKSATNKLKIDVVLFGSHSITSDLQSCALFQDATANALAASMDRVDSVGVHGFAFTHWMTAGTTSATTFKVRAGGNAAGTFTFNGTGGGRRFGGVMASSITITEIKA